MKDILRRHQVLKLEIVDVINKQIKMEAHSSSAYLAMAGWCDLQGYDNCADFFFKQSEEERKHQLKFFHYLTDMEAQAISPAIGDCQHDFENLKGILHLRTWPWPPVGSHAAARACRGTA